MRTLSFVAQALILLLSVAVEDSLAFESSVTSLTTVSPPHRSKKRIILHNKLFDTSQSSRSSSQQSSTSTSQLNNFFKDLLDSAFENDPNLSTDKSEQQLEGPNDGNDNIISSFNNDKTEVQKRWLESQQQLKSQTSEKNAGNANSFTSSLSSTAKGAPINPELLPGTKWELSFFLTGIPNFDPNNSLYGSKVNISTRKDSDMAKDGFAIGADSLPSSPSATSMIQFLNDGVCQFHQYLTDRWPISASD